MVELDERLRSEAEHADILEIWLDSIRDLRLAEIFFVKDEIKKPLLFVNKAPQEGGDFMGSPEAQIELLLEAVERGADYVDVAIDTDPKLIKKLVQKKGGTKVILSTHNFKKTPSLETLKGLAKKAHELGADLIKVATYVKDVSENVVLFDLLRWGKGEKLNLIVVGMGDHGNLSRVMAPLLGSSIYYAPLDKNTATAPGQLTKQDLDAMWEHLDA